MNQLFLELMEILLPLLADRLEEYVLCLNSVGELGIAKMSCTDGRRDSCLLMVRSPLLSCGSERKDTQLKNKFFDPQISLPLTQNRNLIIK